MGTRSLVRFFEGEQEILCVYQQYDGYPSGVGATLAEFLKSGRMVNGIPCGVKGTKYFNGMGCLAAQFIKSEKKDAGGLYIYAPGSSECGEEYVYEVHGGYIDGGMLPLQVNCFAYGEPKYSGDVDGFMEFCTEKEAA